MNCANHILKMQPAQSRQIERGTVYFSTIVWTAVLLAAMAAGLSGCAATRPNRYYQLTVPSGVAVAPSSDSGPTLVIANFSATHLYREDTIVYSAGVDHMGTYEHQRWTEPPTEIIAQVLLRELRASGHYRAVYTQRSTPQGDFLIHGRINDFKEVDVAKGTILARVTFELEMHYRKTGATVWTHHYTDDEPVSGKDMAAVVAAFDKNVQRGVRETAASLDQYFASHPLK
jgi:ABC-type uncharacterized transport system auxiliary subunit